MPKGKMTKATQQRPSEYFSPNHQPLRPFRSAAGVMEIPMRYLLLIFSLFFTLATAASENPLASVRALVDNGQYKAAASQLESHLKQQPNDPQGRFLQGVVLAEQGKTSQAIEIFSALTKEYPELPEPHNNLAVLFAAQGDYVRARDALLVSINTHPSYATAHENLGDIYARMAGMAYDKALHLDRKNKTAKAKLGLVRNLFSSPSPMPSSTAIVAAAKPTKIAPPPAADTEKLMAAVQAWATAWSQRDVDAYLGFYSAHFKPANGRSRRTWKKQRARRLRAPAFIEIKVRQLQATLNASGEAEVRFVQEYHSDSYHDRIWKILNLVREGDRWLISGEYTKPR